MELVKKLCLFLLLPVFTYGQTVHVDSGRIVYKGILIIDHVDQNELLERAKNTFLIIAKASEKSMIFDSSEKKMIAAKGSIRLSSPHTLVKTVEYILEISVKDGVCKYRIDSVYLKEVERGGKTTKISSEKLLKGMEQSGAVSAETEKQLNEIDMHFQKLIDLLRLNMNGAPVKRYQ